MPLSPEEKAKLLKLYERNRLWRKYRWPAQALLSALLPLMFLVDEFRKEMRAPTAGQHLHSLCFIAFLFGMLLASAVTQAFIAERWRKRDNETLDFMEKHFPDDCPWTQEESILRQAEELAREARASNIVAAATRSGA